MEEEDILFNSLAEAAQYAKMKRMAVLRAIRFKKLKAYKKAFPGSSQPHWIISKKDLDAYRANKYNREEIVMDGERVFDLDKGTCSVHQAAKILSKLLDRPYTKSRLYYFLRIGVLKAHKKGIMWVLLESDLEELFQKEKAGLLAGKYVFEKKAG